MKLHELRPAEGSRRERTRVGRGIAAGKGKTAGRGTKGQKARAGASIPAWFEGGQTPLHIRVPKLRGFKNRFRIEYQVVNVGRISAYAEAGRLDAEGVASSPSVPVVVTAEVLHTAGLIATVRKPVKVLGQGDVGRPLFLAVDAVTRSARQKIEGAGGTVQLPDRGEAVTPTLGDEPAEGAPDTESTEEAPGADVPNDVQEATPDPRSNDAG